MSLDFQKTASFFGGLLVAAKLTHGRDSAFRLPTGHTAFTSTLLSRTVRTLVSLSLTLVSHWRRSETLVSVTISHPLRLFSVSIANSPGHYSVDSVSGKTRNPFIYVLKIVIDIISSGLRIAIFVHLAKLGRTLMFLFAQHQLLFRRLLKFMLIWMRSVCFRVNVDNLFLLLIFIDFFYGFGIVR